MEHGVLWGLRFEISPHGVEGEGHQWTRSTVAMDQAHEGPPCTEGYV